MTTKNVIASVDHSILGSSTWEIFHTIFNLVAMPQLNHRVDFWEQAIAIVPGSYTYFLEALCSWSKDSSSIYHVRPSHRIVSREYCLIPILNRSMGTHIGLHWVGNRFYGDTYWISISYCTGLAIVLWGHTLVQYFIFSIEFPNSSMGHTLDQQHTYSSIGTHTGSTSHLVEAGCST